jgi:hypothetical protein
VIISRVSTYFKPYYVLGKELHGIRIYNAGKIIYENNCGWLEHHEKPGNPSQDCVSIEVPEPIKISNKLNLNRTDNFIIIEQKKPHSIYGPDEREYMLYIHESHAKVMNLGEKTSCETDTTIYIETYLKIDLPNTRLEYTGKRSEKDDSLILEEVQHESVTVATNYSTKLKEFGEMIKRTEKDLEKEGIKINSHDLEKLLKKYDLVRRLG